MSLELLLAGCTVTTCHRYTRDLPGHARRAEIASGRREQQERHDDDGEHHQCTVGAESNEGSLILIDTNVLLVANGQVTFGAHVLGLHAINCIAHLSLFLRRQLLLAE